MRKLFPALAVVALALAGCSSADSATVPTAPVESSPEVVGEATPEPSATTEAAPSESASDYAFATGMTFGKVSTDGAPSEELEAYLVAAGEAMGEPYNDEFTFWTVKVDNREGFDAARPLSLRVYDDAGKEYLFASGLDLVEMLNENLPDAPENATGDSPEWKAHEKLFSLYQAAFEAENILAHPGAVKEFIVVTGDKLPSEFAKMTIDLGGLVGEADVITLEDAESQGYPLDF